MKPLKLYGHDADDMRIISAHVQDAVLQIGDLAYRAEARRFVMLMNRFMWEAPEARRRVRSALQIRGVVRVARRRIKSAPADAVLSLLALDFTPEDAPAGMVSAVFAGGGEIRLAVEACEVILEDVSAPWPTQAAPAHDV